jgi:hypothetical protein
MVAVEEHFTCPDLLGRIDCAALAAEASLLNNRRDAVCCKIWRKKATHLEKAGAKWLRAKRQFTETEANSSERRACRQLLTVFTDRFNSLLFVLPGANRTLRIWFSRPSSR